MLLFYTISTPGNDLPWFIFKDPMRANQRDKRMWLMAGLRETLLLSFMTVLKKPRAIKLLSFTMVGCPCPCLLAIRFLSVLCKHRGNWPSQGLWRHQEDLLLLSVLLLPPPHHHHHHHCYHLLRTYYVSSTKVFCIFKPHNNPMSSFHQFVFQMMRCLSQGHTMRSKVWVKHGSI